MAVDRKRKRATEEVVAVKPIKVPRAFLETTRDIVSVPVTTPGNAEAQLELIALSDRTLFEKKVWSLLCQIPPGHVSTYGLMSAHLNSSPRAVGNALRRNPFAPGVPCHRVVATGGQLGGFKGHWSRNGEGITIDEKKKLLGKEGVKIDPSGKVLGTPWAAFV
ncbi:6-O-methylguanine DNA methyltransferase [Truncatella angustata]|uniref:Methylated-DNA--protein-cysteine methyltransferase n=1 Tax=Truncatella angustata TaxID=152316 RepID=A0A9P8UQN6_9PEZI|nr:6-O-methylguanine DNA methyltransferase [Truncatella angustata]KAH6656593.1 6-O-methylguanine DNA methyltransferase [Truncatella angustata]